MSKALTDTEFSNKITEDRTWRIREISDIKAAIHRADASMATALLRALVALAYAHWEGYVRFAATQYLEYIARRRLRFGELSQQFRRNYFLPRLASLSTTKASIADRCDLVDQILRSDGDRFARFDHDLINTRANLNSEVFTDICIVCDVPTKEFESMWTFIDIILLKRRNSIAHGEETLVTVDELDQIANETIGLMRTFGNALENHVALRSYRKS